MITEQAILNCSISKIGSMQTLETSLLDTRLTMFDQYLDESPIGGSGAAILYRMIR